MRDSNAWFLTTVFAQGGGVSGPFSWKLGGPHRQKFDCCCSCKYSARLGEKMYESREKMRVDEIVDQVVGRSWLQGCPNICAATHFHARSSSRANVVLDVVVAVSFAVCRFFIWNSQMCWHCHCWSKDSSTHTEGCGIPHLHKRGRKNRGYSSGTVGHSSVAYLPCQVELQPYTFVIVYNMCYAIVQNVLCVPVAGMARNMR